MRLLAYSELRGVFWGWFLELSFGQGVHSALVSDLVFVYVFAETVRYQLRRQTRNR